MDERSTWKPTRRPPYLSILYKMQHAQQHETHGPTFIGLGWDKTFAQSKTNSGELKVEEFVSSNH